jgi:glycosyltransferase involved in cell wall biosynthesis
LDKLLVAFDARSFHNYDVFFSPCEAAPYAIEKSGLPIYIIIHDLIPIVTGEFPVGEGYWLYDVLKQVSPEKHYFCISNCTKQDFLKYCSAANPKHVKVTYNGYEPKNKILKEEAKKIIHNAGLVWKRYILILGNVVPHKNVERQINASVRFIKKTGLADFKIAIVGSVEKKEEVLERAQVSNGDRDYIVFCGYVPDDHIEAFYTGAFCLSFTSLYEGFGLPALEAMSKGCPVITSNTSSLPEVVGNAAICIPSEDVNAHIEAYTRLLNDQELGNKLIERGKERATEFRWDMTAQQMIDEMKNGRTL